MVDHIGEGTKFGRYALLEKIGTGGMAEIFRAKTFGAAGFEKEFAIKLILPSLVDDSEFVEMFINEAKIAVSLYHANIVQVFDLGEIDSQYYIAMEYVLGKDLLEILARCAERNLKIPLNLVIFVTMEMLKGLNFAHRAKDPYGEDLNIIHRDVSPSNIMISYAGDVKVGDFGVAKAAIERTLTESGTLKGKVGYMSPEQVMGEEIDTRSDVFAAGVVFFEALSMSRLFVGGSDLEVMLQVRDADIEESIAKAEPLPAGLREIVERALAKHPEERYQTSGEFYQALVDFCYHHSIKVTGTDLSNFMRRLFAEEIEAEKSRRRAEPRLQEIVEQAKQRPKKRPPLEKTPPPGDQKADQMAEDMPLSEAEDISGAMADAISKVNKARHQREGARFRYLDSSGLIYGPMNLSSLVELIDEQDEINGSISVDGGDWRAIEDIDELAEYGAERAAEDGLAEDTEQAPPPDDGVDASETDEDKPARRSGADTVRASAPQMGDEKTTMPEDSALAKELEAAVSSLEQLSHGLGRSGAASGPDRPNLELSSSVFDQDGAAGAPSDISSGDAGTSKAIEQLKNQYASYEGELGEVPFARILARLHRSSATGRLYVQRESVDKSIFLRDGEPILVESNRKEELLGSFLLRRERITRAQLDEALDRLSEWGGRLGDALVAIGALEAHDIFELLAEQMRDKLLDVFTWAQGHYGYYENHEPDTVGYPLGLDTYSTIVQACRAQIPIELIERYYRGRTNVPIYRPKEEPLALEQLKLSSRELRVLTQITQGTTLDKVLDATDDDRHDVVLRTVYLLHQVEALHFETTDKHRLPGD
ncbi:MAG: protein kinase domain-containing protein [Persicimonas sp.]